MFESGVFWFFAVILVGAALCVIVARNPVHSALFLVLSFFTARRRWGFLVPVCTWALLAIAAAVLIITFRNQPRLDRPRYAHRRPGPPGGW